MSLRAVIKVRISHARTGASAESFRTIDFECPELEEELNGGGFSETHYEFHDLVGIEVLPCTDG